MDQIKIGKFIAENRKALLLTQRELAEKLHISDKAISKWET
ncbi:MAG: helix-turn-helix transcriptional regulator, partial [Clostridiales bacterium]|nr:helix-turn-helix transcriptional regulator [Clostridiales bacterium]